MPPPKTFDDCRRLMDTGWHGDHCDYCESPSAPMGKHDLDGTEWEYGISDEERRKRRLFRLAGEKAAFEELKKRLTEVADIAKRRAEIAEIPRSSGMLFNQKVLEYQEQLKKDIILGTIFAVSSVVSLGTGSLVTSFITSTWSLAARSSIVATLTSVGIRMTASSLAQAGGTKAATGKSKTVLARGAEIANHAYQESLWKEIYKFKDRSISLARMIVVRQPGEYYDIAVETVRLTKRRIKRAKPGISDADLRWDVAMETWCIWKDTEFKAIQAKQKCQVRLTALDALINRVKGGNDDEKEAGHKH
jgi:hypothetical protein